MAGSYNHAIDKRTGKLYCNEDFVKMVENLGDAYETVEEMYGMIWFLASSLSSVRGAQIPATALVELARVGSRQGLESSPGTDGKLDEEDV